MILMTREGGATSERLLTISVWALVWTFSGMDSPVTSERAGIAEWFAASFAHVWLLASVDTHMHGQRRPLDELLATARVIANVWTDAAVNALMSSQIASSREALATSRTRECLWWAVVARLSTTSGWC